MQMTDTFPDGTIIDKWFYDDSVPELEQLGTQYVITDYGIKDVAYAEESIVYTAKFQQLIDTVADNGGGVIVVPRGIYMTGALFFKQGVNLYICKGGVLRGSDDISDYPVMMTRIEGENCMYYPALINVNGVDGMVICGEGTIDGNGARSWRAFWQRRSWNPECTNKDEQRARLVYISDSTNITVAGLHMCNSQFWTNHIYKSNHVKYLNCHIYSPRTPVKAPSTDAVDIDVCSDILIKGCVIEVNDDAVALKGGKGPWADSLPENGINERIIIEDCQYGFCHGCLTCGSESVHNKNVIMRHIRIDDGYNLLWLKMRPDTPQRYEYITVEDVRGRICSFININPWTQFYDLKDRKDIPLSYAEHIVMRKCECECDIYYNVMENDNQYRLSDIKLEDNNITETGRYTPGMHTGAE